MALSSQPHTARRLSGILRDAQSREDACRGGGSRGLCGTLTHTMLNTALQRGSRSPQPWPSSYGPPHSYAGYIGEFEVVDDHRSGKIVVDLIGRINKCGVISPRFDVCHDEIEQWVVNLLPARTFGHIILTTSYGIMDHDEARRKHTGGKILGFFY